MNRVQVKSRDGFWCTIEGDASWCEVRFMPKLEWREDRIAEIGPWGIRVTMPGDAAPIQPLNSEPTRVDAHWLFVAATICSARIPLGQILDRMASGQRYFQGHEYDLLDGVQSIARLAFETSPDGFYLDTGEDRLEPASVDGRIWPVGSGISPPEDLAG